MAAVVDHGRARKEGNDAHRSAVRVCVLGRGRKFAEASDYRTVSEQAGERGFELRVSRERGRAARSSFPPFLLCERKGTTLMSNGEVDLAER